MARQSLCGQAAQQGSACPSAGLQRRWRPLSCRAVAAGWGWNLLRSLAGGVDPSAHRSSQGGAADHQGHATGTGEVARLCAAAWTALQHCLPLAQMRALTPRHVFCGPVNPWRAGGTQRKIAVLCCLSEVHLTRVTQSDWDTSRCQARLSSSPQPLQQPLEATHFFVEAGRPRPCCNRSRIPASLGANPLEPMPPFGDP